MSNFAFRAAASAVGGFFTRPVHEPLKVQAASFLPRVGGYGSARVENFRFHEFVSFKAAYTQVIGTEFGGKASGRTSLSAAVVEGLNILDMVTADRVVGRLASESSLDAKPSDELSWLPLGCYFVNLRIAGIPVDVRTHPGLLHPESGSTLTAIRTWGLEKLFDPDDGDEGRTPALLQRERVLRCSMFEPLRQEIPGATVNRGCRIRIPGFGDVYLGEYMVAPDHRQLTMLRVEMHSPTEGSLSIDYLEGNGSPF
jgi:hypothetical protein